MQTPDELAGAPSRRTPLAPELESARTARRDLWRLPSCGWRPTICCSVSALQAKATARARVPGSSCDAVGSGVPGQAGIARRVGLCRSSASACRQAGGGVAARTEQHDEKDKSDSHAEPRFDIGQESRIFAGIIILAPI